MPPDFTELTFLLTSESEEISITISSPPVKIGNIIINRGLNYNDDWQLYTFIIWLTVKTLKTTRPSFLS